MENLKGIIIENEWEIPGEIRGFIKDNPTLFSEVDEQTACNHRPLLDVARFIPDKDAIILMSTFMYKEQLEQFVQAFAQGPLSGKPFKFFIFSACYSFNNWNTKDADGRYKEAFFFDRLEITITYLKRFVEDGRVFSIEQDWKSNDKVFDNYWQGCSMLLANPDENRNRDKWVYKQVLYNSELDVFHLEGQDPVDVKKWL